MTAFTTSRRTSRRTAPRPERADELDDARAELAATREILRVIVRSRADAQPVLDCIAHLALELCGANSANVFLYDGTLLHIAAMAIVDPRGIVAMRQAFPRPASRDTGATRAVLTRAVELIPDVTADPDYKLWDQGLRAGFRSVLAVPLLRQGEPIGAIAVGRPEPGPFREREVALLQTFAEQAALAIENARQVREIEARNATIRALVEDVRGTQALIGRSPLLAHVRELIGQVAATDSTVLIEGETGTGKELVARALHAASTRCDGPLIRINCAALPRELVESELFGHEKGAFTGAIQQRRGRFELADGGTLFLDEVGELPADTQAKLLRVLQEREFERVGGTRSLRVDVRILAATNRDLRTEVAAGRFRSDLFFRLSVFPLTLPPLRERREDVPLLLEHFARHTARRLGRPFEGLAPAFVAQACAYGWPGNVRELENVIERALILSHGGALDASDMVRGGSADPCAAPPPRRGQASLPDAAAEDATLAAAEQAHIRRALDASGWTIEGARGAARRLGIPASTLRGRMRKLGLHKPG
jgi:formate hydrogenlyase transcriptional activator